MPWGFAIKEPDSAARLIRGPKTGVRRPLCGHLDTGFGGKRGGPLVKKHSAKSPPHH
jgi:hypothetical protein